MPIPIPPRVDLTRLPTPLEPLDNLNAVIGGPRIWVKRDDLTEGPAGGNKLRKLEFSIGQALADGADVLITAGAKQSNHCRQTAFAAAKLGLTCHLVLAGRPPRSALDGNLLLDDLMGAEITYVSGEDFEDLPTVFEGLCDAYTKQGRNPFCIPVGASDEIGLWGYIDCVRELKEDFRRHGIAPSHIVAALGSGGTHGGLMVGAELFGLDTDILGFSVARDKPYLERELSRIFQLWNERYGPEPDMSQARANIMDGHIGPGYGQAEQPVFDTIRLVARLEGLIFDPVYVGKAFDALLQEIKAGRFSDSDDLVFLHTGGIYGIFPHRQQFTTTDADSD